MEEVRRETNRMYVLVLFSCLFFLYPRVQAQDLKTVEDCSNSANYTSNSQFQANLNLLLRSLVSNGTRDGFFNTTIGANPDSVYGLVQCRGDISMKDCRICLNTSSVEILQICPNRKEAALRTIDDCLLRYSNIRFFDQVDDRHPPYDLKNPEHVSEADADRFDQQLEGLMDNLSNTASSRPSRYDAGWTDYTVFENIFGLVQCTRDLSPTNCLSCLRTMISRIPGLERSRGAKVFTKNCYMRFEMSQFVLDATGEISTTTGNGKDNSTNVVAIVVPIVASVFLLAICGFFIHRRRRKNRSKRKPEINCKFH